MLAGPVHAAILTLFQYFNLVLSSIGYTVAAGQSLRCVTGYNREVSKAAALYGNSMPRHPPPHNRK
jgi:hypothetical protein